MSYRFLPYVRRGLAANIAVPDPLSTDPPARARFNVKVALSTGSTAEVDLRLYGPGDVIGVDTRAIVRTEPRAFARDFPPDQLPSIEFDPPDFPWMFTPAAADMQDRVRPWLVLIAVEKQEGVGIRVLRDRPLPQLVIEGPAVPAQELPDLSESWAWAHAHVVEESAPSSVADHLRDNPDLNVARLLCPRRLASDREYYACLVPAFEVGRLAGLGQDVPEATTAAPAWGGTGGVGLSITLPLYFHWEFRTGAAGDFEALARRLEPRPVPDNVGFRRMFIGKAHPALPELAHDEGGIVKLEGALRAPDAGSGTALGAEHAPWVEALVEVVNAPAAHVVDGASNDAESVSPPIYGGPPAKAQTVSAAAPKWLRELNSDPRHRAAAGLGTEIVRLNQERYMQAAWEQVGDVLAANALLDRARFLQQVIKRVYQRHIEPLRSDVLLSMTAPVHARVAVGAQTLEHVVKRSTLPAGAVDASFRRMSSPRSTTLTKAIRFAGDANAVVAPVNVLGELAQGERRLDVLANPPDGLIGSSLLDRFSSRPGATVGPEVGTVGSVPATMVAELRVAAAQVEAHPAPEQPTIRPDLAISGVIHPHHVHVIAEKTSAPVASTLAAVLETSRVTVAPLGFRLPQAMAEIREIEVLERAESGSIVASARGAEPVEIAETLEATTGLVLEPPDTDSAVVGAFVDAFQLHSDALAIDATSIVPEPIPLDTATTTPDLVAAVDPTDVVEVRARLSVHVAGQPLAAGALGGTARVFQREPLDQIMAAPTLVEPLYLALAKADPDRLLPGVGAIPDDTVTMLETNPRFVEAFLIGANHEMNREELWRGFPTDKRGTPFRRFWDRIDGADDIGPIHAFSRTAALGTNGQDDLAGSLCMLVRGHLLRRYPNSVVYAVPAVTGGGFDPNPSLVKNPLFWGRIDPDVTFVGFDLTREDVDDAPGWYFVIAEQPTEPRFGFDTPLAQTSGQPASWSDVEWDDLGIVPNVYLKLAGCPQNGKTKKLIASKPETAVFGRNAADMAAIAFQRPFRVAIHSSEVIEGVDAATTAARPALSKARLLRRTTSGGTG